jgi:tetratricopeptide (TPR) repeat protein
LPDLPPPVEVWPCDLGELSPSGCRKLRLLDPEGLGSLDEAAWRQVMFHLGGHPKALELLGGYLRRKPDRARTLVENFGEAVETVDRRLALKRQERGRQLLVDTVLTEVPEERLPSFDRLCLLEEPLPSEELGTLLADDGISHPASDLVWLRDHGLLARKVSPTAISGGDAVHRLLASRRKEALVEREGEEAARTWHLRVAEHLVQRGKPLTNFGIAARHRDAAGDRAGALRLYDRWAMRLRDRHAYAACIQITQEGLQIFTPGPSESERVAAAALWTTSHDGLTPLGFPRKAYAALEESSRLLENSSSVEARFQMAGTLMLKGRALLAAGNPREAEEELETALGLFTEGDHSLERAVTLGDIARLRSQAGDVAGALKLHEERLRTYDQLGDVWSRAVTLGDIARLRSQAGDVAGALKLHEERLRIFEQLGDVRERAMALGDIARLRSQAGDVAGAREYQTQKLEIQRALGDPAGIANAQFYLASLDLDENRPDNALSRLVESWEINLRIGRADGIAFVGQFYGLVLAGTDRAKAVSVLRTSQDAFQRLGMTAEAEELAGLLKELEAPGGEG